MALITRFSLLLFLVPIAHAGARADYAGGTSSEFSKGVEGEVDTTDSDELVYATKKGTLRVPYRNINLIEYGQNASRRILLAVAVSPLFLLSKSRRHFVTVGFEDTAGRQQAIVLRVKKGDIRTLLVSLEARTGRKVEYQDDEARKAGKG